MQWSQSIFSRVGTLLFGSSRESETNESLASLFCKKRQEQFAHGCSFVKSDGAKSNGSELLLGTKRGKAVNNCYFPSSRTADVFEMLKKAIWWINANSLKVLGRELMYTVRQYT